MAKSLNLKYFEKIKPNPDRNLFGSCSASEPDPDPDQNGYEKQDPQPDPTKIGSNPQHFLRVNVSGV